ncbi:MAG: DUF1919 domain-containing protein [Thermoguttaceae bacterium]|jgi:uncharacterized protein (DUF1919 family)|nr:DUF1919 domain-containing protein [Thermoguttaceae bacterium]
MRKVAKTAKTKKVYEGELSLTARYLQKIRKIVSKNCRKKLNESMAARLTNVDFSILSQNCVGGMFYHDLGLRFLSPTINLFFDAENFIRFLERPQFYTTQPLRMIHLDESPYPLGQLDDVTIHFNHYHRDYASDNECIQKWNDRVARIRWENLYVIATDRDGMNSELMARFNQLPYRKIMYVARPYGQYPWAIYLPAFAGRPFVGTITGIANFKGERYYETNFDLIDWINN